MSLLKRRMEVAQGVEERRSVSPEPTLWIGRSTTRIYILRALKRLQTLCLLHTTSEGCQQCVEEQMRWWQWSPPGFQTTHTLNVRHKFKCCARARSR